MYFRADSSPVFGVGNSPIKNRIASGFGSEEERILERLEDGTFDQQAIADSVMMMMMMMDARAMDQTIDFLIPTASPTATRAPVPAAGYSFFVNNISTTLAAFLAFSLVLVHP
jgi:hypothetical protein